MIFDFVPKGAVAVTKSDSTVYDPPLCGFMIGGAGNVAITDAYGVVTTITAPPVGVPIMIACKSIMSTNTTATNITGLKP
jgi:hypothetical protein